MADIELLFGVAGGGEVSGESGSLIKGQLESIVRGIEPLNVKVTVDVEGSKKNWKSDIEKIKDLSDLDGKGVNIKIAKIDASGAIADFKSDLEKIVNSVSISKGVKLDIKGLDVGDVSTDLKQIGSAASGSASNVDRLNAEIKELKTQAASITSAYKSITNTAEDSVNGVSIDSIRSKYIDLQTEIEAMNRVGATSTNSHIAKVRELESEMQNLLQTAKKTEKIDESLGLGSDARSKALSKVNNLIADIARNQREWTQASKGMSSSSYASLEGYSNQLKTLAAQLTTGTMKQEDFNKSFNEISSNVNLARKQIRAAGEATKSWTDRFGGLFKRFSSWLTVSEVVTTALQTMRKMVECVVDVDTAMTELKKVTDASDATYERFLSNATGRARELGATITDVVNATADFARLGHGLEDAATLADVAIVYKNVGDGIENIETASKSIISTMQAFGIEAKDAMSIVDSFNAVGNRFAVSSAGVGEALLNSAAALAAAGNDIHESVALIAAANTTIQDPSRVGTALKTVSMYMRAAKTEAEEAGISTEGMANSVSELREEILALTGNKVDIMANVDTGEYKSTVDILRELSQVWDDLSDTTRTNITELIGGGVRNANVISALMKNFSIVDEAIGVSMESAGSALAENEKYLDSISGRIEKLKASFEALSTSIVDSELTKFFISVGDGLLRIATIFSDIAFDNIFTGLATIASGVGIFEFFKNLD